MPPAALRRTKKQKNKRKQKKTRRGRKQRGGAYLGSGTFGSVFYPPPCLAGTMPPEVARNPSDYVGKLMKKEKALKELAKVKKIQDRFFMGRRIAGRSRKHPKIDTDHFYLHYAGKCIPDKTNPDLLGEKVNTKQLLLYKYGGKPLFKFYTTLLQRQGQTPEKMNIQFQNFMRQLSGLLYGVRSLALMGVVHKDIKNDNIVVGEGTFPRVGPIRLIDFGSACLVSDINNDENLFTNSSINYSIWPLECCVSLTEEGLVNILSTNLEDTRRDLFTDEDGNLSRIEYLEALGLSTDAAELEESQRQVVETMRNSVAKILGQILSEQDTAGAYVYEQYFPIFALQTDDSYLTEPETGYLIFNIDAMEDYLTESGNTNSNNSSYDVKEDVREFLEDVLEETRRICIRKCDVFSVGQEILEILSGIVKTCNAQSDPANNWTMSPDTRGYYAEIVEVCKRMMDPDVGKRLSSEEAYRAYIATGLFEAPVPAGYVAGVAGAGAEAGGDLENL